MRSTFNSPGHGRHRHVRAWVIAWRNVAINAISKEEQDQADEAARWLQERSLAGELCDQRKQPESEFDESIHWNLASETQPDEGLVVLLNVPDASDTVWPGLLDAGEWRWIDQSLVKHDVIAWAEMPVGLRREF